MVSSSWRHLREAEPPPALAVTRSPTHGRITHRKVLKFHALTSLNNGATSPLRPANERGRQIWRPRTHAVAAHAASSVRLARHAPAAPWAAPPKPGPHQPGRKHPAFSTGE